MSHTLNLGTGETQRPPQPFQDLLFEIKRITADGEKLQHIHNKICSELGYRLSEPGYCLDPDYHGFDNSELLWALHFVFEKMMDIFSRERNISSQARCVTQIPG